MKIEITPQTQAIINQFMATGRYANEAEALDAALDERIDPESGMTISRLKAELQKGLDQLDRGEAIPAEEVWSIVMSRFSHAAE
jgi:Arc/MetJ-type ribon-helix-helix transcriptional regulator